MKSKLTMMVAMATACVAIQLTAMPTAEETRRAEPVVRKLMASERAALKSGRKTRSEVADAAMKLADEADTDAAKLLLMKGAFVLYVQDGKLEKAVETMNALEAAIADMPPQSVTNMIEAALLGASKKVDGAQLYKLLDEKRGADRPNVEYKFFYKLENGKAIITGVDPKSVGTAGPVGSLVIPNKIDGHSVTHIGWESFRYCKELTSVTIPEGVTHIDGHAFDQCYGLKSVTLPSSLKGIGWAAFGACAGLTSVTIPNGVRSIAADAFNGCRKVKSLVIPESVTHIGDRAFCAWRELESVTIPSGVANIGKGVFTGCNALKLINVDSGNQAFTAVDGVLYTKNRSELVMWPNPRNAVVIPDGVTKIRGWAFAGGEGMTSVTIPESVTTIDDIVFIGCAGLKSVTIPSRVKSIGEHVFERCVELTEVTMLGERPDAPETLFPGCGKLKAIHVPAKAKSWAGMKEWFGIPLVFDGEARAASEKALNSGNATPKDVPNVEYKFFYKLENGKAIITGIDPKSVGTAGPVGSLVIPDKIDGHSVTHIGWEAFRHCKGLTSVTIPEGVSHIDGHAFDQCYGLKSVTLPSSLKGIGWAAFGGCAELKSIVIPEGVTSIRADTFNGCRSLKNLVIPNSMTHIGERAFLGCQELMSVTIPAKVASIGEGAFVWGSKLKQINLAADNQSFTLVDGVLYKKDMSLLLACLGTMTSVTIPSGVKKIGAFAFRGCTGLKSVTIPEGVTDIGWVAFVNCVGLKSLTIPESVKVIGPDAFKGCVELASVTMRGERPDAQNDIFKDCGKLKAIHVPANAKSWAGMKEWQGIPLVFDAK